MLPKYITATSSLIWRITDRSCEMNSMAMLRCSRSTMSRFRICDWIDTSSADTGSSAISSFGSSASARAMAMRWRCPPENSCGYLAASALDRPTVASNSATKRVRSARPRSLRLMSSGSRTISPMRCFGLSDEYGSWNTICIQRRCSRPGRAAAEIHSVPANSTVPPLASMSRISVRASVDLPQPDSPTTPSVRRSPMSKLTASSARNCLLPGNR